MIKKILLFLSMTLPAYGSWCQSTPECPDLSYSRHLLHPEPTQLDTPEIITPEDDSPSPPEGDETRGIFWVHGLGGNAYSWDRANQATVLGATAFPARDVITAQLTYGNNSLVTAGLNLESEIWLRKAAFEAAGVSDHTRNYAIAHSQGGLVTRMTDKHYDVFPERRMFGGIVTFGTPNGGAYILNSRNSGLIQQFAAEGCQAIGSAELLAALGQNVSPLVFSIISNGVLSTVNGACDLVSALLPYTLFSELNTPVTNDYFVGASELAALNSHGNPDIYKVAMHGVEYADGEDPLFPKQLMWRTFSSRDATSAPVFGADDDDELVDLANQLTARYLQEHITNALKAGAFGGWGIPALNFKFKKHIRLANAFGAAYNFMQKADDKWKSIIGVTSYQPTPNLTDPCQCVHLQPGPGPGYELQVNTIGINSVSDQQECEAYYFQDPQTGETIYLCAWQPYVWEYTVKPSDGVVL